MTHFPLKEETIEMKSALFLKVPVEQPNDDDSSNPLVALTWISQDSALMTKHTLTFPGSRISNFPRMTMSTDELPASELGRKDQYVFHHLRSPVG